MATKSAVRLAPRAIARKPLLSGTRQPSRTFFNLPSTSSPQNLTAHRTLPYAAPALYELIADIDSYSRFLPYCTTSRVTSWSDPYPPEQKRRYPTAGTLTAGWSGLQETYSSRVFCVPSLGIVEAISGDAVSTIPASELQKYGLKDYGSARSRDAAQEGTFKSLVTRWTVRPLEEKNGQEWSQVDLSIRFQFVNPLFAAVSSAVADKIAPVMVDAFEKEARRVLGRK